MIAGYHQLQVSEAEKREAMGGADVAPNIAGGRAEKPGSGGAPNLHIVENLYRSCARCGLKQGFGCACNRDAGDVTHSGVRVMPRR